MKNRPANPPNPADDHDRRIRVRVRFAKRGDLRLISHRDMVRAFERMFRRVGISLAMSQGFHPRPLMTFPDALSLGIAAENEVMDIVLSEPIDPEDFRDRLAASCPPGLVIHNVRELGEQERKAKIEKVVYEMDVPDQLQSDTHDLQQAINTLQKTETLSVTRKGKQIEIDLKETLDGLWLDDKRLMMTIRVVQQSQLQPRDILAALGLQDVIVEGALLTRTKVELYP